MKSFPDPPELQTTGRHDDPSHIYDAIVVGGGQSGLATGYYLRKRGVNFLIIDNNVRPGGAWTRMWPSLTLFSASDFSSLPGRQMPHHDGFPPASHVVDYLTDYEARYDLPVVRPLTVNRVQFLGDASETAEEKAAGSAGARYRVLAEDRVFLTRHVIMATGVFSSPKVPEVPGSFTGTRWHSQNYPGPEIFKGTKVAVVGEGNSGAQIAAELSEVADVTWFTLHAPEFLPPRVDGRVLFARARRKALAAQGRQVDGGEDEDLKGNIVQVPPVKKALEAGRLNATPMVDSLDELEKQGFDHLIWCTGFKPALRPVRPLLDKENQPLHPGLHLVGYGDWAGVGSATLVGVGPYAKAAAQAVAGGAVSSR